MLRPAESPPLIVGIPRISHNVNTCPFHSTTEPTPPQPNAMLSACTPANPCVQACVQSHRQHIIFLLSNQTTPSPRAALSLYPCQTPARRLVVTPFCWMFPLGKFPDDIFKTHLDDADPEKFLRGAKRAGRFHDAGVVSTHDVSLPQPNPPHPTVLLSPCTPIPACRLVVTPVRWAFPLGKFPADTFKMYLDDAHSEKFLRGARMVGIFQDAGLVPALQAQATAWTSYCAQVTWHLRMLKTVQVKSQL